MNYKLLFICIHIQDFFICPFKFKLQTLYLKLFHFAGQQHMLVMHNPKHLNSNLTDYGSQLLQIQMIGTSLHIA